MKNFATPPTFAANIEEELGLIAANTEARLVFDLTSVN
jgi:hypothetical protein